MSTRPTMLAAVADGDVHPTAQARRLTQWWAGTACCIALVALAGWVLDVRLLAGQWGPYLPMAPSTALALLLFAGGLFGWARWPSRAASRYGALAGAGVAALLGSLVLVESIAGYDSGFQWALARTNAMFGPVPLGRMSPLTAVTFLLGSAALMLALEVARWRAAAALAVLLATLAIVINLVVLVGYSRGAPLLYGGPIIPVAVPTALAFVLLSAGQINLLLPSLPALRAWHSGTLQGVLLRAFLPAVFLLILAAGWTNVVLARSFPSVSPAVWESLIALAGGGLLVAITGWIARRTGNTIERAYEAQRRSEDKYRLAVDATNDGMWDHDLRDGTVHFNERYVAAFDTPSENEDSWAWWSDHVHPEDRNQTLSSYNAAVNGSGDVWKCEYRFRRVDGTWANTSDRAHIARDSTGKAQYVIGALSDMTENKRAEAALRASAEEFRSLAEAMPQIVWVTRKDGWNTYFNQQWVDYTGLTLERSHGHGWNIPFHPDDQQRASIAWQHATSTGGTYSLECRLRRADGVYRWFLVRGVPLLDDAGEILKWFGTCTDIHDIKQSEAAFVASELRYRRLFESARDGILILDADTAAVVDVNPFLVELLGLSRETILGTKIWDLGFIQDIIANQDSFAELLREEYVRYEDKPLKTRDGRRIDVEFVSNVYLVNGRKVIQCNVRDITERKRAEEEKAKLEAQLQQAQKMESVGRLAGGVAHDFNNMLGVILGHADLAIRQVNPDHALHRDLDGIRKAAMRSADLTRQLLAFARKQTVAPEVLDLNQTVGGMLTMLHRLIGENIDLRWQPGADLWAVEMDPSQIDQILANLCVNARDAISGVGKMTIETGNSTLGDDYCAAHAGCAPGEYVRLAVSDDGCGMDKDTLSHVFEPFFTTKATGEGTGLGLSTVYGAVKQNGGFINVYSEPNHGTTFTIYLPRHIGKAVQVRAEGAAGPLMRGHETILLVEDEPSILAVATRMLEQQGYAVLAASTPGEALRLARQHAAAIHLLLTDVVMPEMNGRVLAKNLLSLYPHLKRLFMSGYTADVIAHHGVLDVGVRFIQKPFSMPDLAARVREALDAQD